MTHSVVIGLGNPYRHDDGVGRAVIALLRRRRLPGVVYTTSLEASGLWQDTSHAVIVQALPSIVTRAGLVHHEVLAAGSTWDAYELPVPADAYVVEVVDRRPGMGLSAVARHSSRRVAGQVALKVCPNVSRGGVCCDWRTRPGWCPLRTDEMDLAPQLADV